MQWPVVCRENNTGGGILPVTTGVSEQRRNHMENPRQTLAKMRTAEGRIFRVLCPIFLH